MPYMHMLSYYPYKRMIDYIHILSTHNEWPAKIQGVKLSSHPLTISPVSSPHTSLYGHLTTFTPLYNYKQYRQVHGNISYALLSLKYGEWYSDAMGGRSMLCFIKGGRWQGNIDTDLHSDSMPPYPKLDHLLVLILSYDISYAY